MPPQPQGPSPEPPQSIRIAASLMYIGAALTVLSFVVALTQLGDVDELIREELQAEQSDLTEEELDTAVGIAEVAVYGVLFLSLAFAGVWVWMAVMNSRGRSWARVLAAILGGLNIAFTLVGLVAGAAGGIEGTEGIEESPISTLLSIASAGLAAIILILLFQATSSAYYNAVTQWRSGQIQTWGR